MIDAKNSKKAATSPTLKILSGRVLEKRF